MKTKRFKRVARLTASVLTIGAMVTLAACGGAPAENSGPQTLTIWNPQDQWRKTSDYIREHTAAFKELHPNVTVEVVDVPYQEYEARYQAAFSGGVENQPDVFIAGVAYYAEGLGVSQEAPADLQELWNKELLKATAPSFQVDGKWYGYPASTDLGMQLFYNVDMFEEAGLDPSKPPTTFDELLDYAKKLAKVENGKVVRNGMAVRYSGSPTGIADKALPYIHAFGGRLYSEDNSTSDGYLNSEGTIAGLTYLQNLVHGTEPVSSIELGTPDDTFAQGLSAMSFREGWYEGWLDNNAPDVNYLEAPYPDGPSGYPKVSLLFNWAWQVNGKSPKADIAWDWMRTTFDQQTDLELAKLEGYLPVWLVNYEDPFVAERKDYVAVQKQLAEGPGPYYGAAMAVQVNTRIGEAFEQILQGADVKSTLDAAVPEVDVLLKQG